MFERVESCMIFLGKIWTKFKRLKHFPVWKALSNIFWERMRCWLAHRYGASVSRELIACLWRVNNLQLVIYVTTFVYACLMAHREKYFVVLKAACETINLWRELRRFLAKSFLEYSTTAFSNQFLIWVIPTVCETYLIPFGHSVQHPHIWSPNNVTTLRALVLCNSHWDIMVKISIYARLCLNNRKCAVSVKLQNFRRV